jgi:hypothetical protein
MSSRENSKHWIVVMKHESFNRENKPRKVILQEMPKVKCKPAHVSPKSVSSHVHKKL